MSMPRKFCTSCGQPLEGGARFCGSCGSPVVATGPAAPPPPPAPVAETVTGVVPGVLRRQGVFSIEAMTIIITSKRLLFALMSPELIKEEARQVNELGAAGGTAAREKYHRMQPDDALAENPDNFYFDRSLITRVLLERGTGVPGRSEASVEQDGSIIIETAGARLPFMLPGVYYDGAAAVLRQVGLV